MLITFIFLSQLLANQWNRGWGDVSFHDILFTFRFCCPKVMFGSAFNMAKNTFSMVRNTTTPTQLCLVLDLMQEYS